MSYQTIQIPFTITSYDRIPLTYTLYLQDISINTLDYSYNITIPTSSIYSRANIYSKNYTFTGIYINSGIYRCYIKDSNDISYNTGYINPTIYSPTFSYGPVSTIINTNSASISIDFKILYPCYNSTYTFLAVASSSTDISFSSIYDASAIIHSNTNKLTINNITRSSTYTLSLIHTYNSQRYPSVTTQTLGSPSIKIEYDVSFTKITTNNNSVELNYTITSYDIGDNITYIITASHTKINSEYTSDAMTIDSIKDLSKGNITTRKVSFYGMDSGIYTCSIIFNNNNTTKISPGIYFTI
jgi:hypothetical protein